MPASYYTPQRTLAAIALLAFNAAAADEADFYFAELPVVATASRLPQRLDKAPASVTVIDQAMIKASGARHLNDVLRLVPGFQTFPGNTDGARVAYHGLNDEEFSPRVQVLVDGRSMYSPVFSNGVNWSLMPVALSDIERIEVVRGSNNVSYGSNAFLGVINIITVDPALTRGFSVSTNQGSQGVRDYTLRAGSALGKVGNIRLTYEQKDDDGLTDRYDWRDYNRSRLFNVRADFQPTTLDSVEISLGRVEASNLFGRLQKNGSTVLPVSKIDDPLRDYDQSSTFLQAQWRRVLGEGAEFTLRYAFTEDWASDIHVETNLSAFKTAGVTTPTLLQVDNYGGQSRTHEIEALHQFSPADNTRIVWGGSGRYSSLTSPDFLYGRASAERSVGRLFGNLEWQPVHWFTGNLGLSIEDDSLAGTHASPRISTNFHLNSENTIRFAYGKAYRTGSSIDYLGDRRNLPLTTVSGTPIASGSVYRRRFLGNPDMPSEKLETFEIGYLSEWKKLRMSFDVRGFIEKVPNRLLGPVDRVLPDGYCDALDLVLDPVCTGIRAGYTTPIQRVKTQGVEYQWHWQPFDQTRLQVSQAFIHISSEFLPGVPYNQRIESLTNQSAPTHTTSMLLMQKLPFGVDLSLAGYWLGAHRWSQNTAVPGYQRLDARLAYPFKWAGQRGEIAYTVQSLDGEHIEYKGPNGNNIDSILAARIVERRQWVSLRLDF